MFRLMNTSDLGLPLCNKCSPRSNMSFPETLLSVISHFHNSLVLTFEIILDKEEKSLSLGLHFYKINKIK
jgi:hypothetical protein